jgi:hypothetical protein
MWRSYPKVTCKKDLYPKSLLCIPNFVAILLAGGFSVLIKAIGNPLSIVLLLLIIVIVTATVIIVVKSKYYYVFLFLKIL